MQGGVRQICRRGGRFCLVLAAAALMGAGGYWFYQQEKRAIKRQKCAELQTIAGLKSDQIAAWRQERLSNVSLLSHVPVQRELDNRRFF